MWFIFLTVGLVLLTIAGLYVRHRLGTALLEVGISSRSVRIVRWAVAWLVWGYPLLLFVTIFASRLAGSATLPRYDGLVASYLLAIPFTVVVLVVLQAVPWLVAIDIVHRVRPSPRRRAVATLAVLAAFAVYTPARILWERGDVHMRHYSLAYASSPTVPPFRIAFLADVQQDAHTDAARARALYSKVNAEAPDVVFSGGDWINMGPDYIEATAEAAGTLKSRLGTFSVHGDHEHFAYVDRERSVREVGAALARHGVALLDNEVRWFDHPGKRIAVLLLDNNYISRTDGPTAAALVSQLAGADYKIVVAHQLDASLAQLLAGRVDLILGAHTHGGQVNPVVGFMHVCLARLETPYVNGRYELDGTTIIVTAGIGMSVVPIRYAAPGSIELIDVRL